MKYSSGEEVLKGDLVRVGTQTVYVSEVLEPGSELARLWGVSGVLIDGVLGLMLIESPASDVELEFIRRGS